LLVRLQVHGDLLLGAGDLVGGRFAEVGQADDRGGDPADQTHDEHDLDEPAGSEAV
jgi:hypothetical protein